ncbi:hypothetical protein HNQ85_000492 [Anoxybacillus calidus]|uniref:Uncharacterized protein n=1 Tax=[Anoxybacillus] calidus TaxID=575178 RepID=A0A7W0BVQ7_9BACL|nr:hypothetical protein [Anoxybacillus calidus]
MVTLFISIFIFNLVAFLMKKKLSPYEYYSSILFSLFVSEFVDRFTDKYNWYYFFEPYFIEGKTLLVVFGIYPAATMLIINWYPYHGSKKAKILYLLLWSIFSTFYEWIALKANFLHHNKWNLWYSAILYPFLYGMLIWHLKFIHWLTSKQQ